MSQTAIQVEGLSKRYRLGGPRARYHTFREAIVDAAAYPLRRLRRGRAPIREFWALRDINFRLQVGEIVGIIGRNGAGKSTLLKILARVTEPTEGRVGLAGRVSSLLEVGTGFHPELTGRENVFLNAAILGMGRQEIRRKFDEIVAFAEVEKFIDTPVKRYSSGMQMRLAFAVAAHLEPEILVIDEVLAVGDAAFQRKCLNKMQDVSEQGRTILIVSHSMPTVTRLCRRAILLDEGRVILDGPAHRVVDAYLGGGQGSPTRREWPDPLRAPGDEVARLRAVSVRSDEEQMIEVVDIRRPIGLCIEFDVLQPGRALTPNLHLYNEEGVCVFVTSDTDAEWAGRPRPPGRHVSTAWVPGNFFAEGKLTVHAAVSTLEPVAIHFYEREAIGFHVIDSLEGDSVRGRYAGPIPGVVRPWLRWTNEFVGEPATCPARASEGALR